MNPLFLLEFSVHDDQARIARSKDYTTSHNYNYIQKIVQSISILDDEDISEEYLRETVSLILAEDFKAYVYNDEELSEFSIEYKDSHVVLSTEQDEIKNSIVQSLTSKDNKGASLIVGGAGTGKTLICIRLLDVFNRGK